MLPPGGRNWQLIYPNFDTDNTYKNPTYSNFTYNITLMNLTLHICCFYLLL